MRTKKELGEISIVTTVAIVLVIVVLQLIFWGIYCINQRQRQIGREITTRMFSVYVRIAAQECIGEQLDKIGYTKENIRNIVQDYFSHIEHDAQKQRITFFITDSPSAWQDICQQPQNESVSNEVFICVKTCKDFSDEWLVMFSSFEWKYGDISIVDTNFLSRAIKAEYSFPGGNNKGRSLMIDGYEYTGSVSHAEDD